MRNLRHIMKTYFECILENKYKTKITSIFTAIFYRRTKRGPLSRSCMAKPINRALSQTTANTTRTRLFALLSKWRPSSSVPRTPWASTSSSSCRSRWAWTAWSSSTTTAASSDTTPSIRSCASSRWVVLAVKLDR